MIRFSSQTARVRTPRVRPRVEWFDTPCRGWSFGRSGRPWSASYAWCLLFALAWLGGCSSRKAIEVTYGTRRGAGAQSVNGTSVLASMFEAEEFKVYSWHRLSPKLAQYDVILWAPNDFELPGEAQQRFLERWLAAGADRTLIFVGRDYDAAEHYWRTIRSMVPAQQRIDVMRQQAIARALHATRRMGMPPDGVCEWFAMQRDADYHQAAKLDGPWARDLVRDQTDLWVQTALCVPTTKQLETLWGGRGPSLGHEPDFEVLLYTGATPLVTRVTKPIWNGGQILVVSNGSFLLNFPLINHENRKLAGRVIQACGTRGKVAFLESGPGGPRVYDREPEQVVEQGTRERVLMALHWFVLGLVFCFSVFPIFGRARTPRSENNADFGQHIEALGALLQQTKDESFARRQVGQYRAIAYRESGVQHIQATEESGQSRAQGPRASRPLPTRRTGRSNTTKR